MPDNTLQFIGDDGCVYLFDVDKRYWKKVYPVNDLPQDIRKKAFKYLEDAEDISLKAEALKKSL